MTGGIDERQSHSRIDHIRIQTLTHMLLGCVWIHGDNLRKSRLA